MSGQPKTLCMTATLSGPTCSASCPCCNASKARAAWASAWLSLPAKETSSAWSNCACVAVSCATRTYITPHTGRARFAKCGHCATCWHWKSTHAASRPMHEHLPLTLFFCLPRYFPFLSSPAPLPPIQRPALLFTLKFPCPYGTEAIPYKSSLQMLFTNNLSSHLLLEGCLPLQQLQHLLLRNGSNKLVPCLDPMSLL